MNLKTLLLFLLPGLKNHLSEWLFRSSRTILQIFDSCLSLFLQLRCVCKSWNSLISHDSNFAILFSNSNLDLHHLVLSCQCSSSELLVSDSSISSIFSSTSTTSFTRLNHPLLLNLKDIYYYYSSRVSICYGMLCVRVDPSSAVLCNPSITKFHILKLQKNMDPNLIHFSL